MQAEANSVNAFVASRDGTRIAYRAWPKSQARITIAVAHGLGEHSGRYASFAEAMGRRGFGVFAVDLRGHGLSQGQRGHVDSWSQWIDDISAFLDDVGRQVSGEVVPLGHSFGGVAMLSAALEGRLTRAKRFIVSSPALQVRIVVPQWKLNLGDMASRLMPRLAMSNDVDAGTLSRIPEVVAAYRSDPLVHSRISSRLFTEWQAATQRVLEQAGDIKLPFLILAGTDDRLINPAGSEELHRRSAEKSVLHLLPGRFHEPFNDLESEEVFDLVAGWLNAG